MSKVHEAQVGCALVYADNGVTIWWNNSMTFNVWAGDENIDVFMRQDVIDVLDAMTFAREWAAEEFA